MPDLLTHTLIAYPLKYRYKKYISIILLGTVLPDVIGRIPGVIFPYRSFINWLQLGLHTPVALLLVSFLLSLFFPEKIRKNIFFYLIFGVGLHLFLDLFQKTLTVGYLWLFPFSFSSFNIPLIWPNDTIYLIPIFIVVNLIFLFLISKPRKTA
jgi:membrane-bound metal-dependent hydrolase YbcI (DUF457 family)